MTDAETAIETLKLAARYNRDDPLRKGSLLEFPNYGQLVMTGDLHGHERNFEKLAKFCDLERYPVRHVILHELVHTEPEDLHGPEYSSRLMLRAAEWKVQFPDQVHFLQSNHALAQLTGQEITKGGRTVIRDFNEGVARLFGRLDTGEVLASINEMIASYPYAARTPNNVFLSHSLPDACELDLFDSNFVTRPPSVHDYKEDSDLYRLVWGRDHSPELLERLGQAYDADFFIVGHQPQETGWFVQFQRLLILASDHNHGVFLPIDLSKRLDMDQLVSRIRPFVSIM